MTKREKIAVIGLGSIGGVIAGSLCAAGQHDIVACVRHSIERLTVVRPDDTIETPIHTLTNPEEATPVDWVFLCTKVQDIPSITPWLTRLCCSTTRVAVMQNGIDHEERLSLLVQGAIIVPVIVYYNGERLASDSVRFRQAGPYDLAVRADADGRAFTNLLEGLPMRVHLSDDFHTLSWRKLLINAVANPITALTMQRQAVFRRDDIKKLCLAVLEEAVVVGCAAGALFSPDEAEKTLNTLLTYPAEAGTSMYFDRLAGRTLEIEALTGAIVETGAKHGILTPINTTLLVLLQAGNRSVIAQP